MKEDGVALRVRHLAKKYGNIPALAGVSLSVHTGEIYGLLGPNGAGKSTLISIISGVLEPTAGEVFIRQENLFRAGERAKRFLGVVPQEIAIYEELSAEENLRFFGSLYGMRGKRLSERVSEVLEWTGLTEWRNQPASKFSGGMKRRLNIGAGIVHQPAVLVLDEPTAGVDVAGRLAIHTLVRRFADEGGAVLLTTHHLEEAEALCDRVAIIDGGRILAEGTTEDLVKAHGVRSLIRINTLQAEPASAIVREKFLQCEIVRSDEETLWISAERGEAILPELLQAFSVSGITISEATLKTPGLETLFLTLTGKELRG
ncbi:MAG: ABC transporter ATP-binding protein [bacterium JZ-2024 1]